MRDKLIHDYFGVDIDLVWEVSTSLLPPLRSRLNELAQGLDLGSDEHQGGDEPVASPCLFAPSSASSLEPGRPSRARW